MKTEQEVREDLKDDDGGSFKIRGMYRVKISDPDGVEVGDSGWRKNVVTSTGLYQIFELIADASPSAGQIGIITLAEGSSVVWSDDDLTSPVAVDSPRSTYVSQATSLSLGASNDWSTMAFTGTFSSGWNAGAGAVTLRSIGLYDSSGPGNQLLYAGSTFSSSAVATNQEVQVTYNILMGNQ